MHVIYNLLRSYAVFTAIAGIAWCTGLIVLVPLLTLVGDRGDIKKIIGIALTALLAGFSFTIYFTALNRLLNVSLWLFLFYSIMPIITALVLVYLVIRNLRLGW